jgi:ABC-2 type transport system permease protein
VTAVAGLGRYLRFIARRERVVSAVWAAALAIGALAFASAYPGLFPTQADLQAMVAVVDTPAMIALMGPVYGLEALTPAMVMAQECLIWFLLAIAAMNIFFVNRHTRDDEELGRLEMLRSLPVGRLTDSAATLAGAFALNLAISVLVALGLVAVDIAGTSAAGAFAYGLAIGAVGFLFAALTLMAAQLFSTTRGVIGWSFACLGLFYILRAAGDISNAAASHISPVGLALRVHAFHGNQFWPLAAIAAEAVLIAAAALAVCARRDLGQGVIPDRAGRRHAARGLLSPLGLAWRLTRRTVLAWTLAALATGATYGAVVPELDRFATGNSVVNDMLEASGGGSMISNFTVLVCAVMAMLGMIPAILAITRLRTEEKLGRLDQIYSKAVSRNRILTAFGLISVLQGAAFTVISGLGLYAGAASSGKIGVWEAVSGTLIYLPAIWSVTGLTVLLVGFCPKFTGLAWVLFTYSLLVVYFGRIISLPGWAAKLSPFSHIPQLPVQEFTPAPLIALTVIALTAAGGGAWAYRRRDVAA